MIRHLCISVAFLVDRYHGVVAEGGEREWPPSPLRLYQALLAGGKTRWNGEMECAFRWLGRQSERHAPVILAPRTQVGQGYKLFVPNNDGDKVHDRQNRLKEKKLRPTLLLGGRTLHYQWPVDGDPPEDVEHYAKHLDAAARRLRCLGWGIDTAFALARVVADEKQMPGGDDLVRWKAGGRSVRKTWRVPNAKTLDGLERVHQSFLNQRAEPRVQRNREEEVREDECWRVGYSTSGQRVLPPRPYRAFRLAAPGDGRPPAFRPEVTMEVAGMMRHQAWQLADGRSHGGLPEQFQERVCGHRASNGTNRIVFLPLPSVRRLDPNQAMHVDGRIRLALVAEAHGEETPLLDVLDSWLQGRPLMPKSRAGSGAGEETLARATLYSLAEGEAQTVLDRYVGAGREWATVTPVILPGHDDKSLHQVAREVGQTQVIEDGVYTDEGFKKVARLIRNAFDFAGIAPEVVEAAWVQRVPIFAGSLHARQYRVPHYFAGPARHFPRVHMRVRFREDVEGPLAIGAGSFHGLGLLARC